MKITTAGKHILNSGTAGQGGATSVVLISGSGGGTLTLGYFDEYGDFIPFTDGVVTSPSQTTIKHGIGVKPVLDTTAIGTLSVVIAGHS